MQLSEALGSQWLPSFSLDWHVRFTQTQTNESMMVFHLAAFFGPPHMECHCLSIGFSSDKSHGLGFSSSSSALKWPPHFERVSKKTLSNARLGLITLGTVIAFRDIGNKCSLIFSKTGDSIFMETLSNARSQESVVIRIHNGRFLGSCRLNCGLCSCVGKDAVSTVAFIHLSHELCIFFYVLFGDIVAANDNCWMIKRPVCLVKQFSLLEIISTATVLLAMVVESSRVFHVVG